MAINTRTDALREMVGIRKAPLLHRIYASLIRGTHLKQVGVDYDGVVPLQVIRMIKLGSCFGCTADHETGARYFMKYVPGSTNIWQKPPAFTVPTEPAFKPRPVAEAPNTDYLFSALVASLEIVVDEEHGARHKGVITSITRPQSGEVVFVLERTSSSIKAKGYKRLLIFDPASASWTIARNR